VQIGPGTRAVVTGASRGIGRAVAHVLAARGATVGLAARSTGELQTLASKLPGSHHPLTCDVALPASVATAVEEFVAAAGGLDLLVANAGIAHYEPIAEQSLEHIEQMTQVNWLGTVYTVKAALPGMLERGAGHVVIVSSGAGIRSFPGAAAYGATKAAQRGFGEALRHELKGTGVGLTMVYPGQVKSSLHAHEKERMPEWYDLDSAAAPEPLAKAIVEAVEQDKREVFYPPNVRLLRIVHGVNPGLADAMLRRIMHRSAAP
jgi:short-subunit dehydrogenase